MSFDTDLASSLRENLELVEDLARYADGILDEKQVRRRWHLANDVVWERLGTDESFVERVELERTRRIRSGATKRELAQLRVVKAPEVLGKILEDERSNPRHKIDAAKALDSLAGFVSERPALDQDRVVIRIDLGADVRAQGLASDPSDVIEIEAQARPVDGEGRFIDAAPQERPSLIEASEQFEPEVVFEKRGRGRPPGSKNRPKQPEQHEAKPRCAGFDV